MECQVCTVVNGNECRWCDTILCEDCSLSEGHTGEFKCSKCEKHICNTYKQTEDVCWFCVMSFGVSSLNKSIGQEQAGEILKAADEYIDKIYTNKEAAKLEFIIKAIQAVIAAKK